MAKRLDDRVLYILNNSINGHNDAFTIARIIEDGDNRKRGSMHLAVKMAARRLESKGMLLVMPAKTEHDSIWYALRKCPLPDAEDKEDEPL